MNTSAAIFIYGGAACAVVVALIAAWQRWRSVASWLFVAGMLLLAAESVCAGLAVYFPELDEAAHWQHRRLGAMALLPCVWLLFSLIFGRANYKESLRQWRAAVVASFVVPVLLVYPLIFPRRTIFTAPDGIDQSRLVWIFRLQPVGVLFYAVFLGSALLVLMNLERTFRAAVGTMRWRLKFMVLGLVILFAVRAYTASQTLVWHDFDPSLAMINGGALVLACVLCLRSLFRNLSEVAVVASRDIFENSLTVLVAGVYLVCLGFLVELSPWLQTFEARIAVLLVGLIVMTIVALSDRVRMHGRRFISRYFQRPFYDYRTVWRTVSEGIVSRVKQTDVCRAVVTLMSDTFQALSVTIWLVDENRDNLVFAASTALSAAAGSEVSPSKDEAMPIIQAMQAHRNPVDFETLEDNWAVALRRLTPAQFTKGGDRVCVPLIGGGQLLGFITVGDRVSGVSLSLQDFDLLRCVADQVAAGLLNAQLSQKLLQAKELEAFQTMSAFFVHDLKNTASTLNLMLQNLPIHFDNPEFREDALRGMAKTCEHINHLISRLTLLRHDLQIKAAEADLNEVVSGVVADWKGIAGVTVLKNLRSCPKLSMDKEQFAKVVTNLVINAAEAVAPMGEIRIETSQNNGWVVLSVTDNGCGMTQEFMRQALFRPFQTTKKKGLGIGMFQSKMIVEAHGGRIEVESELRKGTTFRVLMPLEQQTK